MKVIGIGASAGGVEAILELFQFISPDTDAAFVVVQHLAPNQKSLMNELLARQTSIPVNVILEDTKLTTNQIYLMSGGLNITIEEDTLITSPRPSDNVLNLPIDIFFHSLGKEKKGDAIAIILSGSGSDGSRGIRTIKEQGGLILVQDPDTAQFNGMPLNAIRMNIADSICSPKKIAEQIKYITSSPIGNSNHEFELASREQYNYYFERILNQIRSHINISFKDYRESTLIRRMEKRMLVHQYDSLKSYYEYLQNKPEEITALYQDFLIGVTRFFRDKEVFDYFEQEIIEQLFRDTPSDQTIRIWIAACSTGEEAYSMAILMEEYLEKHQLNRDYKIFASDVDKTAIRFASEGLYDTSIAADVPINYLNKYFSPEHNHLRVAKRLQDKILFAYQDILSDPPFIRMNFISCRNFLIYLKSKTQRKVMANFHFALIDEGVLLLGPSESISGLNHAFNILDKRCNYYSRKRGIKLSFRPPYRGSTNQIKTNQNIIKQNRTTHTNVEQKSIQQLDPFSRYLIENLTSTTIFLNQALDILYLNGSVDSFLNLPRTIARLNIRNMTSAANATIFAKGVENAFKNNTVNNFNNITLEKGNQTNFYNLRFRRVTLENWSEDVILVEINQRLEPQDDSANKSIERDELLRDQIRQLEKELKTSRREVTHLRNEIEATTEELQASNRELMASNEELQSTNEELQSVNEELFTVNSEFQIKNQELITANADINNLLKSTEIGTIFLDKELRIRKFTPAVQQQFRLLHSDIGRSITDFSSAFLDLKIAESCEQVSRTNKLVERAVTDQKDNQYLMRVLPYRTADFLARGFVITFVNINELESLQTKLMIHAKIFNSWFQTHPNTVILLDIDYNITDINRPFQSHSVDSIKQINFLSLLPEKTRSVLKKAIATAQKSMKLQQLSTTIEQVDYQLQIMPIIDNHTISVTSTIILQPK